MTAAALPLGPMRGWLVRRQAMVWSVGAVLAALAVGLLLVAGLGIPMVEAVQAFADGAWGSPYALGASLNRSVVFLLVGIGFVLATAALYRWLARTSDRVAA